MHPAALGALAGLVILVAGLVPHLRARSRFVVVTVDGVSMSPTYQPADQVLVRRRRVRVTDRGQVVVLEGPDPDRRWEHPPPERGDLADRWWLIKRLVAVPGDPVPEPVVGVVGPGGLVPDGHLVVVGDNTEGTDSFDSRHWGYCPADRVLGVVVRRLGSGGTG